MAAGSTYTPIATTTISTAVSSYTFSSIPSTYTDIVLQANILGTSGANLQVRLNGDTGTNYSVTWLGADNSPSQGSGRLSNQTYIKADNYGYVSTSEYNLHTMNFMNYANTTTYKTVLMRDGSGTFGLDALVGLWRSTSAINSIQILVSGGNIAVGSTLTIYGIAAA